MSLKKFIDRIWKGIVNVFHKLEEQEKRLFPIVVMLLNNIKKFEDSGDADIITTLIPGDLDDKLNAKFKEWLPKVIMKFTLIDSIVGITDPNEKLKAILNAFKFSDEEAKNAYLHSWGSLILNKVSDGVLSWSDSTQILEGYYKQIYQPAHPNAPELAA